MIISISGKPGSGKTTIAKMLAEKLGYQYHYIGEIMRKKAREKGMTLEEYGKLCENDASFDKEADEYQRELGKKENNFVIQGRTSFYFIPHSIKIYLDIDLQEGAKRIFKDLKNREGEADGLNKLENVIKSNQTRINCEQLRYKNYYNLDINDLKHYDFILDTTGLSIKQVFQKVYEYVEKKIG